MLPPQGDPMHLAALKEEKAAGRVRYIGVQVIGDPVYPQLEAVMRNEPIDFIGVDYDVGNRERVEDTILPLAQERKIGVMAFFPFGNNGGASCGSGTNLFARVGNRPLPEWAAEFDAATWAQFFIKYVISHPAVTVARVGTTKAHHMLDNIGGGIGRLPDEATRRRMAELIDSLPPVTVAAPPQSAGSARAVRGGPRPLRGRVQDVGRDHPDLPPLRDDAGREGGSQSGHRHPRALGDPLSAGPAFHRVPARRHRKGHRSHP